MSIKGQDQSLTFAKGHSDFQIKTWVAQKLLGHLKVYINELGHITKMATMPIHGKYLEKSSPEPVD